MLRIDGMFYLYLAVLLLTLPLPWFVAAMTAAVFHELSHLTAIYLLNASIKSIDIKVGGAVIHTQFHSPLQELICTAAGPAGSLLLLTLCHFVPRLSLCAAIQGLFNLLPLYPLDGGRILHCSFQILIPETADLLFDWVQTILRSLLGIALFFAAFWMCSPIPILTAALLLLQRKIPCKEKKIRVQ